MDNTTARAAWEDLVAKNPKRGSILRYHMESAKATLEMQIENPTAHPEYYVRLMEEISEYEYEQREHGNDDTYLAWCDENFGPFVDPTPTDPEVAAKAAWESLNPQFDTMLWYEKWAAESVRYQGKKDSGRYYQNLMATLAEFQKERAEFGDDDGYLSCIRDEYEITQSDIAKWDADAAAEAAAKETGLDLSGTGHIIGVFVTGCYDA